MLVIVSILHFFFSESQSESLTESETSSDVLERKTPLTVKSPGVQMKRILKKQIPEISSIPEPSLQKPMPTTLPLGKLLQRMEPPSVHPLETKKKYVTRLIPGSPRKDIPGVPIYERESCFRPVPLEILAKAKAVKPSIETIKTGSGIPVTIPAVTLVDEKGVELVTLPWRVVSVCVLLTFR